ncbi:MAG: hypothetical protein IPJ58_08985 [Ardenticatenia bacterium]|nr:hypothetical protein [Ardenticatenia bacterium]
MTASPTHILAPRFGPTHEPYPTLSLSLAVERAKGHCGSFYWGRSIIPERLVSAEPNRDEWKVELEGLFPVSRLQFTFPGTPTPTPGPETYGRTCIVHEPADGGYSVGVSNEVNVQTEPALGPTLTVAIATLWAESTRSHLRLAPTLTSAHATRQAQPSATAAPGAPMTPTPDTGAPASADTIPTLTALELTMDARP